MDGGSLTSSGPNSPPPRCWCGRAPSADFSEAYRACPACGTLVSTAGLGADEIAVRDDSRDFYGREYWLSHQREALGLPDIHARAWQDLPERNLYWLRVLLRHQVPPATVLDVGSAHGGFVALLRWAGFEATGVELSPWVVDFARRTFEVPVGQGRLEDQGLAERSLDVIVLNDVLEHLADPRATVGRCAALLKPDGFVVVQTPCYPEGMDHPTLRAAGHPFLEMLQAREHLYLFSRRAARQLFEGAGLGVLEFERALFPYDMYFVASRRPRPETEVGQREAALLRSASSRLVHALIQLDDRARDLADRLAGLESDRQERIRMIERLNAHVEQNHLDYEARGRALEEQEATIRTLAREVERISADSEARLRSLAEQQDVSAAVTAELERVSADSEARLRVIAEQEGAAEALIREVERVSADSEARLRVIAEQQGAAEALVRELERVSADSEARLRVIAEQQAVREAQERVVAEQAAAIASLAAARDRLFRRPLFRALCRVGLLPRP